MHKELCCFDQLRKGEIFKLVSTGKTYLCWQLPGSDECAGLPLIEDCQGEHRLLPHGDFLYAHEAGKCNPLGIMISDLREVPPLPDEKA